MIYDINLIPKAKKNPLSTAYLIAFLIFLASSVLIAVFGFYLPFKEKNSLKDLIKEQEREIASSLEEQNTYATLLDQTAAISQTSISLDYLKENNLKMTKLMKDLENNMPEGILCSEMSLEGGLLIIKGISPTYTEMAAFIVKLRKMENVSQVTFLNAAMEDAADDADEKAAMYTFEIDVRFSLVDAFTQLQMEQTADLNSTGQEVVQNEAN